MASAASDSSELPAEVTARPLALVALAGLDTVNNAVHRAVWEAFSARRPDRAPIRFKLLPNTFELPVVKPKRTSYEWYIPKGILKRNWIPKRLSLVPAVIVVFYDMEWDDPQWNEKILECASRVQSIRAACEGHGTRAAVVVLQGAPAPPPTEYPLGAERAQALCAACEIGSKALFVLGQGASLAGYAARLETALLDLAHSYYHHEARAVRAHRDLLNKTTHHYLLVRHQFKLGFLNELKQDLSAAHKHYQHAYTSLLETRVVDTNLHEVRTVAGFVNHKLCRLLFALNLPRDAIAQQRAHVEHFGPRGGVPALQFEHCAWLARQHGGFGDLFEEAVRGGLPASRAHHPGLYYREAARLTARRRQALRAVAPVSPPYPPPPDPLAGPVEHYGQRPWRPQRLGPEPPDPARERAGIQALQHNEHRFDHSQLIVSFLGAAVAQFKAFHSPRMRRQLVVEMAEEYHLSGDHGKALTLLSHMLYDYRRERWWGLHTHVLTRALRCAYLGVRLQEYLPLAVEALASQVHLAPADRARVLANVAALLRLRSPEPEPGSPEDAVTSARELWPAAAAGEPRTLTMDMANVASFLRVRPVFPQPVYRVDEPVTITVYSRLSLPPASDPLLVALAHLTVVTCSRTLELPIVIADGSPCRLNPDRLDEYSCRFHLDPSDAGGDMRIDKVSAVVGDDTGRKVVLNFKVDESKSEGATHPELIRSIPSATAEREFLAIEARASAAVGPRQCRLQGSLGGPGPALQGERFPVTVTLSNGEGAPLRDLTLAVSLPSSSPAVELDLSSLTPQALSRDASFSHTFHLKASRPAVLTLQVRVTYFIDSPGVPSLECVKDLTTEITVIEPFEVSAEFAAMNFAPITECFVDSPFIVMPRVNILSPCSLVIESTELEVADGFRLVNEEGADGCLRGVKGVRGAVAADAVCVAAKRESEAAQRLGLYTVTWRREDSVGEAVKSSCALAGPRARACPVRVRVRCPARVGLRGKAALTVWLQATGRLPLRVIVTAEGGDAFMVSGYRRVALLVPGATGAPLELRYGLRALLPGPAPPPRLALALSDPAQAHQQDAVAHAFDDILPRSIFVVSDCDE